MGEHTLAIAEPLKLECLDNYRKPRQNYADRLFAMDDAAFQKEAEQAIWLSAYASNNHRSDYHWHAETCHAEAQRRGKPEIYTRAHQKAVALAEGR